MTRKNHIIYYLLFATLIFLSACSKKKRTFIIKGVVKGSNEKVMPRADVHLTPLGQNEAAQSVEANSSGHFQIKAPGPGYYRIQFTGVNHLPDETILDLTKPSNIDITTYLSSSFTNIHPKKLFVIGSFNHFSYANAIQMHKQSNGTYTATVPADSDVVAYQVIGPNPNRPVNGTQADSYAYDGSGNYISLIRTKEKKLKVTFNPKKFPVADLKARLIINNASKTIKDVSTAYQHLIQRQNRYMKAYHQYNKSGNDPSKFDYDWSNDLKSVMSQIEGTQNKATKQMLLLSYFNMGLYGASNLKPSLAKEALRIIPSNSPVWSIQPLDMIVAIDATGNSQKYDSYLQNAEKTHPDHNVKATVLYYYLSKAYHKGNYNKAKQFYNELTSKYGNTSYAEMAQSQFNMNQKVAIGKPVPNFKVTSLTNPNVTYSNKKFLGKYYMLDFWATWCGPCIRELGHITKAYKKYKSRNFTILSLSLDDSPKDVMKFRKNRFKMPWHQAFLKGGFNNKIAKRFGVHAIPSPVLVNPKGIIVATGIDLRGTNLEQTLSHFLGH